MLCMFNTPSKCFFHCANFSSLVLIGCPFSIKMVDVGLALFALMSYNFLKKSPCRLCFKLSSKSSIILSSSHLSQSFLTAAPTALQSFNTLSVFLHTAFNTPAIWCTPFSSPHCMRCTVHSLIHFFRFFLFLCQCSLLASMMVCFTSFHLSSTFPLLFSKHFMMVFMNSTLMDASCRSFTLKRLCLSPLVSFVVSIVCTGSQDGDHSQYCIHNRLWYLGLIRSFSALLGYSS